MTRREIKNPLFLFLLCCNLAMMDTLIKNSEVAGDSWSISPQGWTMLIVDGQPLRVLLREKLTRKDRERPPPSKPARGRSWLSNEADASFLSRTHLVPTGRLYFQIDARTDVPTQRFWWDTKFSSLEQKVGNIIAGARLAAAAVRETEQRREDEQKERQRLAAQRRVEARECEETRRLRQRLSNEVRCWERYQRIQAFCTWVESEIPPLGLEDRGAAVAWLAWARDQAEILKPDIRGDFFNLRPDMSDWEHSQYGQPRDHGWWTA